MRYRFLLVLLMLPLLIVAQVERDSSYVNPRYFEDQFYLGITYNFVLNQPDLVSQRNFSYGLQGGFIKDIPMNSKRTVALGVGLGLALNTYYTNIEASETANGINYAIGVTSGFKRSKLETHLVELPIEFRWRNSTAGDYKFWRIYTGVKLGYAFDSRSKLVADSINESFSNGDVRKLQYGITFNFGYSSFNAHVYYSLTGLFSDNVALNGSDINMQPLHIGLIFYIL
ncbi:MAG: porin family protein [Flavobacteriaceae bacterium]